MFVAFRQFQVRLVSFYDNILGTRVRVCLRDWLGSLRRPKTSAPWGPRAWKAPRSIGRMHVRKLAECIWKGVPLSTSRSKFFKPAQHLLLPISSNQTTRQPYQDRPSPPPRRGSRWDWKNRFSSTSEAADDVTGGRAFGAARSEPRRRHANTRHGTVRKGKKRDKMISTFSPTALKRRWNLFLIESNYNLWNFFLLLKFIWKLIYSYFILFFFSFSIPSSEFEGETWFVFICTNLS